MTQELRAKLWCDSYLTALIDHKLDPDKEADYAVKSFDERFPMTETVLDMKSMQIVDVPIRKSKFEERIDKYHNDLRKGNDD